MEKTRQIDEFLRILQIKEDELIKLADHLDYYLWQNIQNEMPYKKKIQSLEYQLKEKDEHLHGLMQKLQKSVSYIKDWELKLSCYKKKDEQIFDVKWKYKRELRNLNKKIVSLKAKIKDISTELNKAQKEKDVAKEKLRDQSKRYSSLDNYFKVKELDQILCDKNIFQEIIKELNDEKKQSAKSNDKLLDKEKSDLKLQLSEQIQTQLMLNNELKILKETNEKLKKINSIQLTKIVTLEYKLKNYDNQLKSELAKKDAQITEIEKNLNNSELNYQKLKQTHDHKYFDYKQLTRDKELMAKNLLDTHTKYFDVLNELSDSQAKNIKQAEELNSLNNKLKYLQSGIGLPVKKNKDKIVKKVEEVRSTLPIASRTSVDNKEGITLFTQTPSSINSIHPSEQWTLDNFLKGANYFDGN